MNTIPINVGTAIGYLDLDTSGFQRGFQSALKDLKDFNSTSEGINAKLKSLSSAFKSAGSSLTTGVTLPIAGAGTAIVSIATQFESAMSNVQAISGATGEEFEALEQKAIDLGGSTAFSAQEVADAMTEMAKAGWDTQQILDGMSGVLDAAAASGESLATVSTIVADAITGFGLEASDSTKVADLLTQAANSGTIGIYDLGESFKYIAPVANAMGLSIEDVTTAVSAMSMAGIKGSQAGTGLRTMLTNLAKPTDTVAWYMDQLKISLTDTSGNIKPLNQLLAEMRVGFEELTEAEQAEYAAGLAGKEGMSALLSIMTMAQSEYDALSESMYNSAGVADETARVMQDNLGNKIEQLGGALESLAIKLGNLLIPKIQELVVWLTGVVEWFTSLDESTQSTILTIAAVAAAVGPVLLVLGNLITTVSTVISIVSKLKAGFIALNAIMAANPISAVILLISGLATAIALLYSRNEEFRNSVNRIWKSIKETIGTVVEQITGFFTVTIPEAVGEAIAWLKTLPEEALEMGKDLIEGLIEGIKEKAEALWDTITGIGEDVIGGFKSIFDIHSPSRVAAGIGQMLMQGLANGIQTSSGDVMTAATQTANTVVNQLSSILSPLKNLSGFSGLTEASETNSNSVTILNTAYTALIALCSKLSTVYSEVAAQIRSVTLCLNEQKVVYDTVTESILSQIEALQKLRAIQGQLAASASVSDANVLMSSSANKTQVLSESNKSDTENKQQRGSVGNTYIFNSPKAVIPTVAAKLLKQTAQQMAMGIK